MSNCTSEFCTVDSSDGVKLNTRIFKPKDEIRDSLVIVLVHPYSILGGCQGLLKGIASGLAGKGYRAVTFDMRGVGRSTGKASLTGFSEVKDVIAVCKWVCENLSSERILLVGSSAGIIFIACFVVILIQDGKNFVGYLVDCLFGLDFVDSPFRSVKLVVGCNDFQTIFLTSLLRKRWRRKRGRGERKPLYLFNFFVAL